MERFVCPDCGKVSYSADIRSTMECPYCTERLVVLNNQFLDLVSYLSHARLIFDRRKGERRQQATDVSDDHRVGDRRQNETMVIGWVTMKKRGLSTEILS